LLSDRNGNLLNPSDPFSFETNTDDRGLSPKDIYAVFEVPLCKADPTSATTIGKDQDYTGTVEASIGTASKVWTLTITIKGGTQTEGCV
jgi:hypothetical protein